MVRLGVDTWLWASTFEEKHLYCIDTAAQLGAEAIDFSVNDPFRFPAEQAEEKLKQYDMDVVVTTAMPRSANPISEDAGERADAVKFMKKLIEVARILKAPLIGGVDYAGSGYLTGHPRTEKEIGYAVDYLREVCPIAAQYGITIAMEPVKRFESHFLNTAQQALDLIDRVGAHNLKVHLDTFHMNIEEADIPEAIEACGDRLAHLHVVENNRDTPGRGHIPWTEVFESLKRIGYDGDACIETFNPQTLDETARMTYLTRRFADTPEELASSGLAYLKKVRKQVYGQ